MRKQLVIGGLLASSLLSVTAMAQSTKTTSDRVVASAPMAHSGQWRASKLIGVNVYNEKNEKLGDINEILVDKSGKVAGVVVGVGGFLGMGEHDILVSLDKIKFVNEPMRASPSPAPASNNPGAATNAKAREVRNANEKWYPDHAIMAGTKDQLKAIPQFKYSSYN